MGVVKHGETHNVGLIVHYVIQSEQREVLNGNGMREEERTKIQTMYVAFYSVSDQIPARRVRYKVKQSTI